MSAQQTTDPIPAEFTGGNASDRFEDGGSLTFLDAETGEHFELRLSDADVEGVARATTCMAAGEGEDWTGSVVECPCCGREGYTDDRLNRCAGCGHDFEVRDRPSGGVATRRLEHLTDSEFYEDGGSR